LWLDTFELGYRQDGQQLPTDVEGFLDGTVGVITLGNIAFFKFIRKFCVQQVSLGQSSFTQNAHQLVCVFTTGVSSKQLVEGAAVGLTGLADADTFIRQTGQRRQYVDWRSDILAVQVTGQDDLALGDVSGQVRDWMRLVVLWHGKNWN